MQYQANVTASNEPETPNMINHHSAPRCEGCGNDVHIFDLQGECYHCGVETCGHCGERVADQDMRDGKWHEVTILQHHNVCPVRIMPVDPTEIIR